MKTLLPDGWPRPRGYSNGIAVEAGQLVFVAGQVGWDSSGKFHSDDLIDQFRQTLENTLAVMAEAGAGPEHIVRMTWYVTDRGEYLARLPEFGSVYRSLLGKNYPAMACVEVKSLMEERARIEIETTCVVASRDLRDLDRQHEEK